MEHCDGKFYPELKVIEQRLDAVEVQLHATRKLLVSDDGRGLLVEVAELRTTIKTWALVITLGTPILFTALQWLLDAVTHA